MDAVAKRAGYFSIVRWRSDALRDESKNLAVILVEPEGQFGGVKSAPIEQVGKKIQNQGILGNIIGSLERRFDSKEKPNVDDIKKLSSSLSGSLVITEPQVCIVSDVDNTLSALYTAYVKPKATGGSRLSKGAVLKTAVKKLDKRGYKVEKNSYIDDFVFDAVVRDPKSHRQAVADVFSFAQRVLDWSPTEKQAGHFLFALKHVDYKGFVIMQPPTIETAQYATKSYQRVTNWFIETGTTIVRPEDLESAQLPV